MHKESYQETSEISTEQENDALNTTHKNSPSKLQKCKFCYLEFHAINDYLSHIETTHQNIQSNKFMCSECGKQYKTKNELTNHINSKCGTIKRFKCKICDQNLMSAGSLYNHMLRHKDVKSFMCRYCAKLFYTAGQLQVHERIHTQDRAYVCEVCNKGFCHRQSLITHSSIHTGIKPYQCENCGSSFSCVGNLIKHRKTHADTCGLIPLTTHRVKHPSTKIKVRINTPSTSRLKNYEKGKEIQKELENLKTELRKDSDVKLELSSQYVQRFAQDMKIERDSTIVKDVENKIKVEKVEKDCDNQNEDDCLDSSGSDNDDDDVDNSNDCVNTVEDNNTDEEAIFGIDPEKNEWQIAQTDSKNERTTVKDPQKKIIKEDLLKFIQETSFDSDGYGDCKYCGKRYMNATWLYKHVKNHEKSIPVGNDNNFGVPLHKCSCCKMTFYTKEDSLIHQQTNHADILTCQDCEKLFANRDSLRSHQKVFHQGMCRKAYIYVCEKCGQHFKQKSKLKVHEERNCNKGPYYECSICKKQFSSIYSRNNHMRVHDPEKKLLCKFCAKSFHWKGQLKIHERSHTGEKPFACLYCPKAFAYRESLITHSSMHTGIKPHLCDGCGARFSCIGNLIKHRSSHASECGAWTYKTQLQEFGS